LERKLLSGFLRFDGGVVYDRFGVYISLCGIKSELVQVYAIRGAVMDVSFRFYKSSRLILILP